MRLLFPAAVLVAAGCSWGQVESSPRALLREVEAAYRRLESFEWTALATTSSDGGEIQRSSVTVIGEFRRPGRMRVELRGVSPASSRVTVTDGNQIWEYHPMQRGFCRPDPGALLRPTAYEALCVVARQLAFERITAGLKTAFLAGNRVLRIGGQAVNCRVVTVSYVPAESAWTGTVQSAPVTYWIDARTNFVVQQSFGISLRVPGRDRPRTDTTTATVVRYRVNPKIPVSRFSFRPAEGISERPCLAFSSGGQP